MKAHWYEERRLEIIAKEVVGPAVLDLGYAQMPNPYLAARSELSVTGLDLSPPPSSSGYAETLQGDIGELDRLFGERRFDTIVAGEFIEHLEAPYAFLRSLHAHLTSSGRLVLSTPNPLGFPVLVSELFRDRRHFYTEDHTYYFLPRWVERMLDRTGFRLIRTRPVGLWLPGIRIPWAPVWLSYQVVYVATRS